MKIALVTTIEHGGPVEHARLLARELVAAGAHVRAVTGFESVAEAFAAVGADPIVVSGRSALSLGAAAVVARSCHGFDVVHSHDRRSGLWTLLPPRRGVSRAVRVHTLHGLPDAYLPLPEQARRRSRLRDHVAYRVVEARLMSRADVVVVPSHATLELASRLGYCMDRAVVVHNGVDVVADRAPLGASVGMLTSLEPVKGIDVFLQAAKLLREGAMRGEAPLTSFVVFGTGSQLRALQEQASAMGLSEIVCFPGRLPVAQALAQLQVVAVTSHYESCPMAVLEAMAAGVPVVATRVGGIPEIAPEDAMLLVPPNDPVAVAEAIRKSLVDTALTRARVERARAHVATQRSAATTMEAMQVVYRGAVDRLPR